MVTADGEFGDIYFITSLTFKCNKSYLPQSFYLFQIYCGPNNTADALL